MRKLTYEFIKQSFESEGYTLLSKEYINSKLRLDYICPKGHKYNINWSNWNQGKRCRLCANNIRLTLDFVKAEFAKEGYKLLSKSYQNNRTKLKYICPNNHTHYTTWMNWVSGYRCFYCSSNISPTIEYIRYIIGCDDYILLSKEYKNAKRKLDIECPKGHKFKSCWNNWQQGRRCPICPSQQSKFEKEIRLFLKKSNYRNFVTNDRTILTNPLTNYSLELDIVFPTLNKAIECNGVYWHLKPLVAKRDYIKKMLCEENGVQLLTVLDSEWYGNTKCIKLKIKEFLS